MHTKMNLQDLIDKYEDRKTILQAESNKMLGFEMVNMKEMVDNYVKGFSEVTEDLKKLNVATESEVSKHDYNHDELVTLNGYFFCPYCGAKLER